MQTYSQGPAHLANNQAELVGQGLAFGKPPLVNHNQGTLSAGQLQQIIAALQTHNTPAATYTLSAPAISQLPDTPQHMAQGQLTSGVAHVNVPSIPHIPMPIQPVQQVAAQPSHGYPVDHQGQPLIHGPPPNPYLVQPGGLYPQVQPGLQPVHLPGFQPQALLPDPLIPAGNTNIAMALHASPLDVTVGDKLRDKIIRGKYVDFTELIRNKSSEPMIITQIGDDGETESQSIMGPSGKRNRLTYSSWQKAFFIYGTVWIQAFPHDAVHILKYADTIRELAANKARWYYYDEQFRRSRERLSLIHI